MKKESFMHFFYEIFIHGSAYVVGGYFRDFLLDKTSRDIDVITDIDNNLLLNIVKDSGCLYSINRHGGIKIKLSETEIDIWTINNNWSFKNNLVKLNENDTLNSIAKGCFYNFDSLVINLHTYNYNLRYFNECLNKRELNIFQKKSLYKNLNPSIEANILRAIYLNKYFNLSFSQNTLDYLNMRVKYLSDKFENPIIQILKIKEDYIKYNLITESDIIDLIVELKRLDNSDQLKLDL